jgi:hypothetical protein
MRHVKISLVNGDLLTTPCSIAFLKHIKGLMSTPELAIDAKLAGQLTSVYKEEENEPYSLLETKNIFPFPELYILNFHDVDLPFTYSSLDSYVRRIIRHVVLRPNDVTSVATTVHGPGAGLDASEAMETLLSGLHRELHLRTDFESLQEIILVEKDKKVFKRLQERISYILDYKNFIVRKGQDIFLNPETEETPTGKEDSIDSDRKRIEKLLRHVFVAMPFAKEFDNVYYFGMKTPVEQRRLKCERVDHDNFTGDIVKRIKERIASAEFVIADITGNKPNVFFEVGYADGLQKKIVFVAQQQAIPFDISTQRHIIYDPQDILSLSKQLGELLDSILPEQ